MEVGRIIQAIAMQVEPGGGILVFFQAYYKLDDWLKRWQSQGILDPDSLGGRQVFKEVKNAREGQQILEEYRRGNREGHGGIYLAVCRGKLSEGIDFSDEDARCVIVVGVPFLDLREPKVVIKKFHLASQQK